MKTAPQQTANVIFERQRSHFMLNSVLLGEFFWVQPFLLFAVSCGTSTALPFCGDRVGMGQFTSNRVCPCWFPVTSDLMLSMGIYSFSSRTLFDLFFFPSAHQHPSLAVWHTPPQQPLHRRNFVNDSYELSVFEQEQFTFDRCLASSNFTQQWREIPFCCGTLEWHEALGRQMCSPSCPCILRCPSLNHLVHLSLPWLQMRQNLRYWDTNSPRYQGELLTCSGSHGASPDRPLIPDTV